MGRAAFLVTAAFMTASAVTAQDRGAAREDYFRAVAGFFNLPPNEIAILGDWAIPPEEIPVVLFLARRAGVSPEALVALRDAGQSWSVLSERYHVNAAALHVPVRDDAPTGSLSGAYEKYRSVSIADWPTIRLTDGDIIGLVNVRLISQALRIPAERVLGLAGSTRTFIDLYAELAR